MDDPVSRYEFSQLAARLADIDTHGTRGIAPLAVQLTEVIKDVNDMRNDVRDFKREVENSFTRHDTQHEREEARRISSRRWAFGAVVAVIASIDGPLVTILLARR